SLASGAPLHRPLVSDNGALPPFPTRRSSDLDPLPSFVSFLGFLIPLVAIALGFDAINGEYNRRTLSRVLSQPIYRDALLTGKFLGGLLVIAICLLTLWLLVRSEEHTSELQSR